MLESFFKKGVAKVHETLETGKAEERMTFEQKLASKYREEIANQLAGTGIKVGDDIKVETLSQGSSAHIPESEGRHATLRSLKQHHVTGTFDGKHMEFWFDETNVVGSRTRGVSTSNFCCIIDGTEVPESDAEESVKKIWDAAFAAASLLEFDRVRAA